LAMVRYRKPCQAVGLPHSAGKLPDSGVTPGPPPSCNRVRAGKEPLEPQEAGSVPARGAVRSREVREGNAPASAQLEGSVPAGAVLAVKGRKG